MTAGSPEIPRRLIRAEQVLAARTRRVAIALEGSQDPHNVHAVLRTAEALGVQDVHLVAPRGEAAGISSGVTQGAHGWLTMHRHDTLDDALTVLKGEGRSLWAAANIEGARSLTGLQADGPIALLFGNETHGLSEQALEAADLCFRIDLVGFSGSLNLSVAAAIALWEVRRHPVASEEPGDLPPAERPALREAWYQRLAGTGPNAELRLSRWLELGEQAESVARESSAQGHRPSPISRDQGGQGGQGA